MPVSDPILVPAFGSSLGDSDEYNTNLADIEDALLATGGGSLISGGGIVSDVGLTTTIEASEYFIGIPLTKPQTAVLLTNNATNRVWAVTDPDHADRVVYEVRTDATVPDRAVPVRTIITSGGAITSNVVHPDRKDFASLSELNIQHYVIPISPGGAGSDVADQVFFVANARGLEFTQIGIVPRGSPAGIDDANTCVVAIKDFAGNTIVTKTYNTGTPAPAIGVYGDLGTLSATHKVLTSHEVVTISITQGATSNIGAVIVVLEWKM